jgi:hypothetical protein
LLLWRRGPESRVTAAMQQWLGKQIAQQSDLTLATDAQAQTPCLLQSFLQLHQGMRLKKSHSTPRNKKFRKRNRGGRHGGSHKVR